MLKNAVGVITMVLIAFFARGCRKTPSEAALAWQEVTSADGNFTALMPGKPLEKKKTLTMKGIGRVPAHFFKTAAGGVGYSLVCYDYPHDLVERDGPDPILDHRRDSDIAFVKGRLVSERRISLEGWPGREIMMTGRNDRRRVTIKTRLYMVNVRLYQLRVAVVGDDAPWDDADKFLSSFRLRTPEK